MGLRAIAGAAQPGHPGRFPAAGAEQGVFGTIGRKVRLAVLDFGRSENSIHGCLADAELASDGGSGGTFGG